MLLDPPVTKKLTAILRTGEDDHHLISMLGAPCHRLGRRGGGIFLGVLLGGCLLMPSTAFATDATLTDDAYTETGNVKNYGNKKAIVVAGPPASTKVLQSFVKFDLSPLPVGATGGDVVKATLTVFVDKVKAAGTVEVREITRGARDHKFLERNHRHHPACDRRRGDRQRAAYSERQPDLRHV